MEAVPSKSGRKHTGGWKKRLSTHITQIYSTLDMVKYKWRVGIELSRIWGRLGHPCTTLHGCLHWKRHFYCLVLLLSHRSS
jgi:hypothetical protein